MTARRPSILRLAFVLLAGVLARAEAAGPEVGFDGTTLRVRAVETPAGALLEAVAKATGVRLVIDETIALPALTVEIEDRELEEALRTLVSRLPGIAGHTMAWAPAEGGGLRLVEVAAFGPGRSGAGGTVFGEATDAGVEAEVEQKVLALLRELERARALPAEGDLSPEETERVRTLRQAGFREDEASAAVYHETRRKRLFEELAAMPGGVDAFHRLKVRSYYEPHEDDDPLPHFFSDVGDPS